MKQINSSNLKRLISLLFSFTNLLNKNNIKYYISDNILYGYLLNKGLLCNSEDNYKIVIINNDNNFKIENIENIMRYRFISDDDNIKKYIIHDYYSTNIYINIDIIEVNNINNEINNININNDLEKCYLFNDKNFLVYKQIKEIEIPINIKYNIEYYYINYSIKIYEKYFNLNKKIIIDNEKIKIDPYFIDKLLNHDIILDNKLNDNLKKDLFDKIKQVVNNDIYEKIKLKFN